MSKKFTHHSIPFPGFLVPFPILMVVYPLERIVEFCKKKKRKEKVNVVFILHQRIKSLRVNSSIDGKLNSTGNLLSPVSITKRKKKRIIHGI